MHKKGKFALVMGITRRNSSPMFYAMLPQPERLAFGPSAKAVFAMDADVGSLVEKGTQLDPPGFHLIPLPFADDIREATVDSAHRGA